jgi:phosphomannomutase
MQNIDSSIFKAYDIRGVYPTQINAEVVYKIAQAYVKFLSQTQYPPLNSPPIHSTSSGQVLGGERSGIPQKSRRDFRGAPRGGKGSEQKFKIAVGHDMRLTGEEFAQAAIKGLTDAGTDVVDIGLAASDVLYFAVAHLRLDGGIQITASHNPKEYGGMKLVRQMGQSISGDSGIDQIKDLVISNFPARLRQDEVMAGGQFPISKQKGTIERKDVFEDYIKHILKTFDISRIKPLKIVANTNFGMASVALKRLMQILPVQVLEIINGNLDGNFPKGRPDPLVPENRDETIKEVKKLKPDLGVAWDADADRCFFFDEQGRFVTPAYINALLSQYYLQKFPGGKILHDTRVVRVIDDVVSQNGGVALATKAGHSFIKERMIKEQAIFGSETSGHYYFKDNFYLDNGLMPFLAILEILSSDDFPPARGGIKGGGRSFSQTLAPLREKFYISEEINFEYSNQNIMADIRVRYQDAQVDEIDGLSFSFPAWRFNVRKSNTENLLRLNLEANSAELLKQKTDEVVNFINQIK